jgi:adrenodoxin-NADP+ reductase
MILSTRTSPVHQAVRSVLRFCKRNVGNASQVSQKHVAIVGSGPSGFYTAKYLLEKNPSLHVDLIEQMPVPFGLVRYGVAPDHPEVKSVQSTFIDQVATNSRFRYFGNVELARDVTFSQYNHRHSPTHTPANNIISVDQLRKHYKAVVLACGAEADRKLDIPNEDSAGVFSARSFVNWYNGHPDYTHIGDKLNLENVTDVAIIGHGNVAVDCARILAKSTAELAETDISSNALHQLTSSSVKNISMIGRRGCVQASYTIKELRELTKLNDVSINIFQKDLDSSLNPASLIEIEKKRHLKRFMELTKDITTNSNVNNDLEATTSKNIYLRYLLRPVSIGADIEALSASLPLKDRALDMDLSSTDIPDSTVGAKVIKLAQNKTIKSLHVQRTTLVGETGSQNAVDDVKTPIESIPCQLLLVSVGYKSISFPGVPFDVNKYVVPNEHGRVLAKAPSAPQHADGGLRQITSTLNRMLGDDDQDESIHNETISGLYVVGWLKKGPTGTIATSVNDAKDTVQAILSDLDNADETMDTVDNSDVEYDPINSIPALQKSSVINWKQFKKIDEFEVNSGQILSPHKPREKIVDRHTMIKIAG